MTAIKEKIRKRVRANRFVRAVFLEPYYRIRTSDFVCAKLNRKSIELYRKNKPELDEVQKRVVEDLEHNGLAFAILEELLPDVHLGELREFVERGRQEAKTGQKKGFLRYIGNNNPIVDPRNPFIALTLKKPIVDIANSYLGMYSKFNFFSLNITVPLAGGIAAQGSQRWHRDPGVRRVCKVFLYVSDVDDLGAGPFVYAKGSHHGGRFWNLFPQALSGREGVYPSQGAVEKNIPPENITPALGKAGTIIFCDTLGLHRGGYSTTKERIMFTALFESKGGLGVSKFGFPENFEEWEKALDPETVYALS
ncbi:MAG: hypothetical protein G01um101433_724 [Parcubacteria group bacterium Gr01-1014_33]|nr:MAG: hypothetical protein G01um101433_724 [Parcubacteria group bacterium Gr01-1014_33]